MQTFNIIHEQAPWLNFNSVAAHSSIADKRCHSWKQRDSKHLLSSGKRKEACANVYFHIEAMNRARPTYNLLEIEMNQIPRKRELNDAFKRFQRLPAWPMIKICGEADITEQNKERLGQTMRGEDAPALVLFVPLRPIGADEFPKAS